MTPTIAVLDTESVMNLILMMHFYDIDSNHMRIYTRDDLSNFDHDDYAVDKADEADEDGTSQGRGKHSRSGGGAHAIRGTITSKTGHCVS